MHFLKYILHHISDKHGCMWRAWTIIHPCVKKEYVLRDTRIDCSEKIPDLLKEAANISAWMKQSSKPPG